MILGFFSLFLVSSVQANYCLELYSQITDIVISRPINTEAQLRARGIREDYFAGLDTVGEHLRVANSLRSEPTTAHINFFAQKIDAHVDFMKEHAPPAKSDFLESLRREAKKQRITRAYWKEWNKKLAWEATPPGIRPDRIINTDFSLYSYGYGVVTAPTPEKLGIIPFNRTFLTGVFPLGLQNKPHYVHGEKHWPHYLFKHDEIHASKIGELEENQLEALAQFHRRFIEAMENADSQEREMIELAYFFVNHESPSLLKDLAQYLLGSAADIEKIKAHYPIVFSSSAMDGGHMSHLASRELDNYIDQSFDLFAAMVVRIRREM